MSRDFFRIEKGLHVVAENSDTGVKYLFGAGAPTLDAEMGSIYSRSDDGTLWRKIAVGTGVDKWEKIPVAADITAIAFRSEKVVALTTTAAPTSGGTIDLVATPLAGDDAPFLTGADFTPNVSHILFGHGGTEKLMKVSAVAGNVITLVDPSVALQAGNCFVVDNYLPDVGDAQEKQALVNFNGSEYIKLGDISWNFADGINLTAGYTAAAGNVVPGDSVEAAIQKVDGVNDAQDSVLGTSQGATSLGNFVNDIIPDGVSVKSALESLGTYVQGLFTLFKAKVTGITTIQTVDAIKTHTHQSAKWFVVASLDSNPAQKKAFEVHATHDGTTVADATETDDSVSTILKVGSNFAVNVSTDVNGTGAAQDMRLRVSAPAAVTVSVTRLEVNQ